MSTSKFLVEAGWKDVAAKNNVKDNGLLKKLGDYKRCGEGKHDEALKVLDDALTLASLLQKDKKTTPAANKYLDELVAAAEAALREVAKAKAEADKAAKKQAARKPDDDDDGEEAEASELLTTKLKPLLRLVAKGETMHTLIAKAGKQVVVLLSRKPIPPARRKMLAEELGGGSTKYYPGHCRLEAGATTFVLKAEVAGMSKLVKAALLEQTGLRLNKVKCRGEDGDDDDEDEDEAPESAAKGRREKEEEPGDESEDSGAPEEKAARPAAPGGGVEAKALETAPLVWKGTRDLLQNNIDALKKAVQAQLADEGGGVIDEINDQLGKLDRIMRRLDKRLINSLTNAAETSDAAARTEALRQSKAILTEYIQYVRSERLIDHLDSNPFGVKMEMKATLAKTLMALARAIG